MEQASESTVVVAYFVIQVANRHVLGSLNLVARDLVGQVFSNAALVEVAQHQTEVSRQIPNFGIHHAKVIVLEATANLFE